MRAAPHQRIPTTSEGPTRGFRHSAARTTTAGTRTRIGNQALQRLIKTGGLQPKLAISQPGDHLEQEADRVANSVMRMQDPTAESTRVSAGPAQVQRACTKCEEEIHRMPAETTSDPDSKFEHPSVGSGRPLPDSERNFFEPRFGRDFSSVSIHTGDRAADAARSINALAYTQGNDVVFGEGQYRPGTESGRKLLAHELTHTIQQRGSDTPILQRTIGDGHDLTAARFAGNVTLEAVYDNERLLRRGNTGTAVRILQQALIDAGLSLPVHGVDGDFGPETEAAVRAFQRGTGLTGTNVDGIVGPTTMGWLDQRFSAGPTPAGTSPAATTGCTSFRTFNIDIVSLDGSTRNPMTDLDYANTVFDQCCVRLVLTGGGSESGPRTTTLLGGDTDLDNPGRNCGTPSTEEVDLFTLASADFSLSSGLRVFYVESVSFGDRGYSNPPFCGPAAAAGMTGMAVVTNDGEQRTLAHELGHILMNAVAHPPDTDNLMHETNTATGEQITPTQCTTI